MTDEPIADVVARVLAWPAGTWGSRDAVILAREVAQFRGVETSLRSRVRVLTKQRNERRDEVARLRNDLDRYSSRASEVVQLERSRREAAEAEVARLTEERDRAQVDWWAEKEEVARLTRALRDVLFLSQEDVDPIDAVREVAWKALAPATEARP